MGFWVEHDGRSVKRIRRLVKKKHELEVFDDGEERKAAPKRRSGKA